MEVKKLVPQFNRTSPNMAALFDILSGKFSVPVALTEEGMLNGAGKIIGALASHQAYHPQSNGKSMYLYNLLEKGIQETKGGTLERYRYACNLFTLMGFIVKWDGTTNVPQVTWFDTEGFSVDWDINGYIKSKLYDDFTPPADDVKLGEHFYTQVANLKANEKNRVDLTIDSYSVDV